MSGTEPARGVAGPEIDEKRRDGIRAERERWLRTVQHRIGQHRGNLAGWNEIAPATPTSPVFLPAGYPVPTEPDPAERARVRLTIAIEELQRLWEELGIKEKEFS